MGWFDYTILFLQITFQMLTCLKNRQPHNEAACREIQARVEHRYDFAILAPTRE